MEHEILLTVSQVAHQLQVVPITVYRLIERGDLTGVKVGRVWRIRQPDLQAYLDRSTSRSTGEKEVGP